MSEPTREPRRAGGVAAVSAFQLGLELLFIKLSRYEFGSLSLGVLGLAMLGVALAGPAYRWLGGDDRAVRRAVLGLAPTALLAGLWLFSLEHRWTGSWETYGRMLVTGALCLLPLSLASVPVFDALARSPRGVYRNYAASLAGATLGPPLAFGCMGLWGDSGAFVALLALTFPVAVLLLEGRAARGGAALALATMAVALAGTPAIDRAAHPDSIATRSNAFSRIDVIPLSGDRMHYRTAGINAGTSTVSGTVTAPPPRLLWQLSARAYQGGPRRVLILGSGAGKNVVQALGRGAEHVVAVEINEMIPEHMARVLPAERDPYRDPRVELVVAEGREYAARLEREVAAGAPAFDLVYVPIATLFGTSGHAFTQTYLMTQEAFELYLGLLGPGGRIAIYSPSELRRKVVRALSEALRAHGVASPEEHLALGQDPHEGRFLVIAQPDAPLPPDTVARPRDRARPITVLDVHRDLAGPDHPRDLTDDNPFLYNDMRSARAKRSLFGWNVAFLRGAFLVSVALVLLGVAVLGAREGSTTRSRRAAYGSAFALMGIGYTAYQTVIIQRLAFLVGHPLVATAIVLPASLLGTAGGAWLARRMTPRGYGRVRGLLYLIFLVCIAALAWVPPHLLLLAGWSGIARGLLAVGVAMPPFVVLGTYFPTVFERAEREDERALPILWLLNGFGAVFGAVLAIYGPMMFGFRTMFGVAAAVYATVTMWDVGSRSERHATRYDLALVFLLLLALAVTLGSLELEVASLA